MPGKNRLLAKLLASSDRVLPDSDSIQVNTSKTIASSAGISTYANIDLLPSSAQTGEKALVLTTNRLYIYNNGWYNIAIINNFNPQWITEPSGSYTLNNDGTPTTITVLASDSDDVPITYTAVTNSGFDSIATITHDSDKHNVWTITPIDSDNGTQSAGSGTVTFKASDGVNLVQAVSSFDITFVVSNNRYTTLLVYADSDGTDNQIDASTNNHTITENGNVTSTAFTPYHPGGYSVEFNATDASITVPAATGSEYRLGPDTGWTLEFWVNSIDFSQNQIIYLQRNEWVAKGTIISISTSGLITFYQGDANVAGWEVQISCGTIAIGTWNHVAIVRNGSGSNNFTTYLNGTQQNQATWSGSSVNRQVNGYIGGGNSSYNSDNREFVGFLRDFRYSEEAVYTSNFTVPTEPLTVLSTTKLLYFNGETYIADKASVYGAPTITSNVSTVRDGPYDYLGYTKADHGGSVYFDGAGDYLSIPDSSDFDFGNGDFTIEFWAYQKGVNADGTGSVVGQWAASNRGWVVYLSSTFILFSFSTNGSNYYNVSDGSGISYNEWTHVAIVRDGNTMKMYKNGTETYNAVFNSTIYNSSRILEVGANSSGTYGDYLGYLSDVRIVKGTAVYTSAFTPPSQPLTAISGTSLLTCTNKSDMWDQSGSYTIFDGGGSTEARGFAKFADDDSVQFIPITSWLRIGTSYEPLRWLNDDELKPGTFESWIYQTAQGNSGTGVYTMPSILGWGGTYLNFGVQGNQLRFYYWTGAQNYVDPSGATISLNTWHHVAFSNDSSNNLRIFLDGTLVHTISSFPGIAYASASNGNSVYLGTESQNTSSRFTGYLYNTRITEGLARYTANFTPPTSKLLG